MKEILIKLDCTYEDCNNELSATCFGSCTFCKVKTDE